MRTVHPDALLEGRLVRAQKFVVEGRLMSLNEYVNINRSNPRKGNKAKREQTELVMAYIRKARVKPMDCPIEVGISWIEGRSRGGKLRDVDNIAFGAKFVLDALVECGTIPDDNPRIVRNVYNTFKFNAQDARIEVVLMPYREEGRTVFYMPISGLE